MRAHCVGATVKRHLHFQQHVRKRPRQPQLLAVDYKSPDQESHLASPVGAAATYSLLSPCSLSLSTLFLRKAKYESVTSRPDCFSHSLQGEPGGWYLCRCVGLFFSLPW